jgi:cob(I)alamin adenosyltransferase
MSSIATKTGDTGHTGLAGGLRLSKSDLRVEAYGTVDELNTFLGFARSLCSQPDIAGWTEQIQRMLFRVGAALSTPTEALAETHTVTQEDVDFLTELVYRIEATDGILSDWSLPGADPQSAAYEMARTVCRRAERVAVRFYEQEIESLAVEPEASEADKPLAPRLAIAFLNRLSDLIWLFGRLIELRAGVDARLRDQANAGPNFSRAW